MKKLLFLFAFFLGCAYAGLSQTPNPDYDSTLAQKLGADAYGMKSYVLVVLKTGSFMPADSARRSQLFRGHFANMNQMAAEGKLVLAGPLEANEMSYRGLFILDTTDFETARTWLQNDPTIKEGVFDIDLFQWYGSAALPELQKIHQKIEKVQVN